MQLVSRSSTWVEELWVDLLLGKASLTTEDGYVYSYSNVSRRAIFNLLLQKNMSLGFWVNKNLTNSPRTQYICTDFSYS